VVDQSGRCLIISIAEPAPLGYSMAAGGPILAPCIDAIVVNSDLPIEPLTAPLVVPPGFDLVRVAHG